jgi:hypothetical protein
MLLQVEACQEAGVPHLVATEEQQQGQRSLVKAMAKGRRTSQIRLHHRSLRSPSTTCLPVPRRRMLLDHGVNRPNHRATRTKIDHTCSNPTMATHTHHHMTTSYYFISSFLYHAPCISSLVSCYTTLHPCLFSLSALGSFHTRNGQYLQYP